ncbi:MAG: HAMP domain-containing protein [archaeon]
MKTTILKKMLIILVILTVIPLALLGYLAVKNANNLGMHASTEAKSIGETSLNSAKDIEALAITDSKTALNSLANEAIKVRAMDAARTLASFLYGRDNDVLAVRNLARTETAYNAFLDANKALVVNGDLMTNTISKPLYKEIAFYDNDFKEVLKVKVSGYDGKDYTLDDFKTQSADLTDGKIFVSRLWGDLLYVSTAYAGIEKPAGIKYEGYYRWVTPVYEGGSKAGYVSLKLDSRHIMELTEHISPTEKRYVAQPDALSGNYAYFICDDGWICSHAREYNIKGVLPDGTLPNPVNAEPNKYPAVINNTKPLRFGGYLRGLSITLDEIYTEHTLKGESGSAPYPWAGVNKWVAYAVVPYYTGKLYSDLEGFGWIGVGAAIEKFEEPATLTAAKIAEKSEAHATAIQTGIAKTEQYITESANQTSSQTVTFIVIAIIIVMIVGYLFANSMSKPIKQLKEAADKLTNGELDVKLPEAKGTDEIAELTGSVEMLITAFKAKAQQTKQLEPKKK